MDKPSENEIIRLKDENLLLRKLLGLSEDQEITVDFCDTVITKNNSTNEKIRLFRSLFKGREDVYAVRWESRKGNSGYSPVCQNQWDKIKCILPKGNCNDCNNRVFKKITDETIFNHLSGNIIAGVYPILLNDCCHFLAIDFDKKNWKQDISAFYKTCKTLNIPASIEISRSGNGGHVWIFFNDAISAILARKLGSQIISKTMQMGNMLDMESYDRMFPNQDYLPEGGFGNLIALPLQKQVRDMGYTVFVDDNFLAYSDQWAYLSLVRKIGINEITRIIETTDRTMIVKHRRTEIIHAGNKVRIIISNQIYVSKIGLPKFLYHRFIQLASFANPEFYIAQASRRSTYRIPRFINCGSNFPNAFSIPTGLISEVIEILTESGTEHEIDDRRKCGTEIFCSFKGCLFDKQQEALHEILKHEMGTLCASTGFGKTILAIKLISERKVNTLILVHRIEILNQWKEKLSIFLDNAEIGEIGASKSRQTFSIDVSMIQTLKNRSARVIDNYGQIIVDECHHIAAFTFENILKKSKAKYILGLTATPQRKDGHHPIVFMQCGRIRQKIMAKSNTFLMKLFIRELKTKISDDKITLPKVLSEISHDDVRNQAKTFAQITFSASYMIFSGFRQKTHQNERHII
ncbi:MAG: DEAD/DEAH box helicase family protein [Candidatus Cloacimonetes bacterium]|nr:DEAD/DEAH box helicase family protein [Candidatus Cloacimonadota bacterium]